VLEDAIGARNLEATLEAEMTPENGRSMIRADLGVAGRGQDAALPQTAHLEGFIDNPAAPQDGFDLTLSKQPC
ncbi:MAG TPA: hypothetical protein VFQ05_15135, partial [Candidatus Eisenbacteria bacterium]|nr:hypothetical protein [Candidatus Eisenbacteria bacterium]